MTQELRDRVEATIRLLASRNADGHVTSAQVVHHMNTDPESPFRLVPEMRFGDDTAAADLHRRAVARSLIRAVRIEVTRSTYELRVPCYVAQRGSPGTYVPITGIVERSQQARDLITDEMKRVTSALKRARDLAVYVDLSEQIDDMLELVEGLVRRVHRAG